MAMVLDAFASYVVDLVTQAAKDELVMLLGVSGQIDKMDIKLRDLNNVLADAEKRRITDQSVQEWVGGLKRAMYEAIDILDLCKLKTMERGPSASASDKGCFNPLLFCMQNPFYAHDIGSRIKALNQRLDDIKERSTAFRFLSREVHHASSPGNGRRNLETAGEFNRSGVVGDKIEQDTRKLVQVLLTEKQGYSNTMIVAIVGAGGIGKTTLAHKVFDNEAIHTSFGKRIWLSVNQAFDKVELLRTAITLAGGEHRGEKALAVLQPILAAALKDKKLLLVMDDMWSLGAWGDVFDTPLRNNVAQGSRVLVTTRDERVARGLKSLLPYHRINQLEDEDAWLLLKKQVISSDMDEPQIELLKDVGLKIIEKCGGLPLAVKVMGGLLREKEKQRREWEMVLNDSIWSVSQMPEELNYPLYLSYEALTPCMKQCFLHYSLLPKNANFNRDVIIGMWISEGFLHGNSDKLEELGWQNFMELLQRNLIEPDLKHGIPFECKMHDVVRSFGQYVARDESLVVHSGATSPISKLSSERLLRLCVESQGSTSEELEWSSLQANKSLRTLIVISHIKTKPADSLISFPCLLSLHIKSANVATLVESLHQLKHLRYLCIEECDISELPDNIEKLKFLQFIGLLRCQSLVKLPDSIVKLEQLRTFFIDNTISPIIPKGFGGLTNLRNLAGFPAHVSDDWCSLEELGPLSLLRYLHVRSLENVSSTSFAAKINLVEKVHLTDLLLDCGSRVGSDGRIREEDMRQIKEVFDVLCPPPCLSYLVIGGYFGQQLPTWMTSTSTAPLQSLTTLLMENLACCTQLPDGLCRLPCLRTLQIRDAPVIKHVGHEFVQFYHTSQKVVSFPRLSRLTLLEMVEWEKWEWELEEQLEVMPPMQKL